MENGSELGGRNRKRRRIDNNDRRIDADRDGETTTSKKRGERKELQSYRWKEEIVYTLC